MELQAGLNVLTGETGAGKSIVVGALNLALGGRADADMVRSGADHAVVDALFDIPSGSPPVAKLLDEWGFDLEDGRLLVTREIQDKGRSAARIAGRPATLAQLRELGEWLVDLHGQHEHQSLLAVDRHIDVLDEWGGPSLKSLREQVAQSYLVLGRIKTRLQLLESDRRDRAQRIDLLQYQVAEILSAKLEPGEDDRLLAESRRLANARRLAETVLSALCAIKGSSERAGALESLAMAARLIGEAAAMDAELTEAAGTLSSCQYEIEEVARTLALYPEQLEDDPAHLEEIEERLDLIRRLKRKYGDSIEEIIAFGESASAELDQLQHADERLAELQGEYDGKEAEYQRLCLDISQMRHELADQFAFRVTAELHDLAMEKTRFAVQIENDSPSAKGADRVEFLIAPNVGEPLRPLARIASGGEVSRIMLAIKSAMASKESLPTMVFDEIDVGVGGRTGSVVAEKLAALSRNAQILCITHLPQIACRASAHYQIVKYQQDGRTVVSIQPLGDEERVAELARMLGGAHITPHVIQHAREMLADRL